MKQTNNNPRDTSNEKGWELLALCTGCFLPQDEMLDRLYKRLEEHETNVKVRRTTPPSHKRMPVPTQSKC
jgi:hypothetical protein